MEILHRWDIREKTTQNWTVWFHSTEGKAILFEKKSPFREGFCVSSPWTKKHVFFPKKCCLLCVWKTKYFHVVFGFTFFVSFAVIRKNCKLKKQKKTTRHNNKLMVNCWFGARWSRILGVHPWLPIPFIFGDPKYPNHRAPNQQLTNTWKTAVAVNFHQLEAPKTSHSCLKKLYFPRFSR